jgi:hypothetical protein
MKTIKELCNPRQEIFSDTENDDVQDLLSLLEDDIQPEQFFKVNYRTEGMQLLLKTAFDRFKAKGQQKLIKLTQSMGGGKTHNMISLGLLAKHPEYRKQIIGGDYVDDALGKVEVIGFSGRESDSPNGIWGALAKQLGKEDLFKEYWENGLQAPGLSAWVNLLKGTPKLILFDELAPYLENTKAKTIGNSDLSAVSTHALANLFNALNKSELNNVLIVISDLRAAYQSGGQLLQSSFRELEGEVNRFALDIEPVGSSSDEIYDILKKRIFDKLPTDNEINEIAVAYKDEVEKARQMNYSNMSADKIYSGIKDAYPFHPALRELYERFKENQGFQQTRDLIRLMRKVVAALYNSGKAEKQYLINPFDLDLNQTEMHTTVSQIKVSLSNAISHDIANKGRAVAEIIDAKNDNTNIQDISKLLLVASLADIPNALLGLSISEMVGYLAAPNRDLSQIKKSIDEFINNAWYVHTDRDGKFYYKNVRNLIAELNNLVDSFDDESARLEIRNFLEDKFNPQLKDCYQNVFIFPAIDEISLSEDKIALVLFEPNLINPGLHPQLLKFYEDNQYKNRVMFLSGDRNTMDNLIKVAKEHKAIKRIIAGMREERVRENDPQFELAVAKEHKTNLSFLQASRETFVKLYYPSYFRGKNTILEADFYMEFSKNDFKGEEQIRKILINKQKFEEDTSQDSFRKKCEDRLFTQKEMRWQDIQNRAATNPLWQWHHPRALDDLLSALTRNQIWREKGGYIEKPPFEKETTNVSIQELSRNKSTGIVNLKIIPKYGDIVYYEIDQPPTNASDKIEDFNNFPTDEMIIYFQCEDSKNEHEKGEAVKWTNTLWIGYNVFDVGDKKNMELQAFNKANIFYTTDGSDPKEQGAKYEGEFLIPQATSFVVAIAEKKGVYSEKIEIKIDWTETEGLKINRTIPLYFEKRGRFKTNDSNETYTELALLKKHKALCKEVSINIDGVSKGQKRWVSINFDENLELEPVQIQNQIEATRTAIFEKGSFSAAIEVNTVIFEKGQNFEDWIAEKRMELNDFQKDEIKQ